MSPNFSATRRSFLRTAAHTTGGVLLPSSVTRLAAVQPGAVSETDHFWYRLVPPEDPYIDTHRGSQAFGFRGGEIFLSEDNARSWPYRTGFADAEAILFSSILGNGNVVFATQRRIFLATHDLGKVRELRVVDHNGGEFRPHPLREREIPGWYFYSLDGRNAFDLGGREMLIWGNCGNIGSGPTPANIYYSADGGETVKIACAFGRNPAFQHLDADPADWVGDPANPVICRHVHSVSYNSTENAFYACTGDVDRKNGAGPECHWLRGTYDAEADAWEWKVIVSADANSRFKSGGINFVNGQVYWVADANGPKAMDETYDRGIFCCAPGDLPDKSKHKRLYDAQYELAVMTIAGEVMVVPEYGSANPCDCGFLFSPDLGRTWGAYDLKEFGDRSGVRVNPPNSDGWFRICLRKNWIGRAEVLFLKPKK